MFSKLDGLTPFLAPLSPAPHLSQKTIPNNVSNILVKLQVADRAQAIVRARDAGLGHQSRT